MQQINLYQDQFRTRRDLSDARHLARYLLLGVLVVIGISGYLHWRAGKAMARADAASSQRKVAQRHLDLAQTALDKARSQNGGTGGKAAALQAQLDAKQRLLQYLAQGPMQQRTGFSPFLRGLARQHVPGLWLDGITISAGGGQLRLEGHALAPPRVPALIAALGDETAYTGHTFQTLSIDRPKDADWRLDFVLASKAEPAKAGGGKRR